MATYTTAASTFPRSVIITVTQSSVDNGRLYFDTEECADFFPADAIGPRSSPIDKHVTINAGGHPYFGEIRICSGTRLSPRRSFESFLRQIRAEAGTQLRVTRLSEREYRIDPCS